MSERDSLRYPDGSTDATSEALDVIADALAASPAGGYERQARRERWYAMDTARREKNTYKRDELRAMFDEGFAAGSQRRVNGVPRYATRAEKTAWGKGYSAGAEFQR